MIRRVAGVLMTGALLVALVPGSAAAVDPPDRSSAPPAGHDLPAQAGPAGHVDRRRGGREGRQDHPGGPHAAACRRAPLGASGGRADRVRRRDPEGRAQDSPAAAGCRHRAGQEARLEGQGPRSHGQGEQPRHAEDRCRRPRRAGQGPDRRLDQAGPGLRARPVRDGALRRRVEGPGQGLQGRRRRRRHPRFRHRLHPRRAGRRGHAGRLHGGLRHGDGRRQEHDARRALPDRALSTAATTSSARAGRTRDEAPDPDPIDSPDSGTALGVAYGTDGGHGTHVADIIGGRWASPRHGQPLLGQGLLVDLHVLLRRGPPAGRRLGDGSQRRRQPGRPRRHHQHVAR